MEMVVRRTLAELLALLDLEKLAEDRYRGASVFETSARVFGGQVIAQALVAATRSVDPIRQVHSLHGYFLRPGDTSKDILFDVERLRDGKSFSTRRVTAHQNGETIFGFAASFQLAEEGFSHAPPMPQVPPPEDLVVDPVLAEKVSRKLPETFSAWFGPDRALDVRPAPFQTRVEGPSGVPIQYFWVRANGEMGDDPCEHQAVLAYVSDLGLLPTAGIAHQIGVGDKKVQWASLDHAMWFHRPMRADEWLLFAEESPAASGGRGFSRGNVFTRDGTHVASLAQEGLMRPHRDAGQKGS